MQGTVAKIIEAKGFGFLEVIGEPDVFFHFRALEESIPFDEQLVGRRLEFDVEESGDGRRKAVRVRAAR